MNYICEHCGEIFTNQTVCGHHELCCNFNKENKYRVVRLLFDEANKKMDEWSVTLCALDEVKNDALCGEVSIEKVGEDHTSISLRDLVETTTEYDQKIMLIDRAYDELIKQQGRNWDLMSALMQARLKLGKFKENN